MHIATIYRLRTGDEGTFGIFVAYGLGLMTLELPWRDNRRGESCIPAGTYQCVWHKSSHFGWTYLVKDVPGRDNILFHAGNFAGDVKKGFRSDSEGCILVGKRFGVLAGQDAVLRSRDALRELHNHFQHEPFMLTIAWYDDEVREGNPV